MRFSVIIPLYNKAPYVLKALESVLEQTFNDYELIILNDGSTDDSAKKVENFLNENPLLQELNDNHRFLFINKENSGVSSTRNYGVRISQGEYICFLDADDWWNKDFLLEMDKLIKDYPEAGIYGTNYYIIRNKKTIELKQGVDESFISGYINYFSVYSKDLVMPLWTSAVCIKKDIFYIVGGFNTKLKMSEDFDLWVRIALHYKVVFLNKPLSNYNQDVDLDNRAIGKLSPPESNFAFNTQYLDEYKKENNELQKAVDLVVIVCLRKYFFSLRYHKIAVEELKKIDIKKYENNKWARYLFNPIKYYFKDKLYQLYIYMIR